MSLTYHIRDRVLTGTFDWDGNGCLIGMRYPDHNNRAEATPGPHWIFPPVKHPVFGRLAFVVPATPKPGSERMAMVDFILPRPEVMAHHQMGYGAPGWLGAKQMTATWDPRLRPRATALAMVCYQNIAKVPRAFVITKSPLGGWNDWIPNDGDSFDTLMDRLESSGGQLIVFI
jgi:hypothetical protein